MFPGVPSATGITASLGAHSGTEEWFIADITDDGAGLPALPIGADACGYRIRCLVSSPCAIVSLMCGEGAMFGDGEKFEIGKPVIVPEPVDVIDFAALRNGPVDCCPNCAV